MRRMMMVTMLPRANDDKERDTDSLTLAPSSEAQPGAHAGAVAHHARREDFVRARVAAGLAGGEGGEGRQPEGLHDAIGRPAIVLEVTDRGGAGAHLQQRQHQRRHQA